LPRSRRGADAPAAVTRQLLAFSRRQLRDPRSFALVDTAGNIAPDARTDSRRGHRASEDLAPDTPSIYGRPRARSKQAIVNLAINGA